MKKTLFWIAALVVIPAASHGAEPMEVLKRQIDEGIRLLNDPQYRDPGGAHVQREKLVAMLQQGVHFREFSRLVLGHKWPTFAPGQQDEFVDLFGGFLSSFYITKLQEQYDGETVRYIEQRMLTAHKAVVNITVCWKGVEVPVQVRMIKRDGSWKAYDVMIVGISLMRNYRAQFRAVLLGKSPDQVIELIKEKRKRLAAASPGPP